MNDYYYSVSKKDIYFSSFNESDKTFWIGDDGMQRAQVENGEYYFQSLEEDSRYNAPAFNIDPSDNFEIEASISGPEDELSGYYGIILGQLKLDSSFLDFKINNSGQFFIETNYPITSGQFEQSDFKTFKKLTIRKFDNQFYFFINEKLKYSYPADELFNLRTGPVANGNSAVWLDYFRISTLTKSI